MEKISIVIINYNGYEYVANLLNSLKLSSDYIGEIIVADDSSTDDSVSRIIKNFPQVTIKQTERNSGPGAARNLGFKYAKHELILFVDNDAEINDRMIPELVGAANNYPEYAFFIPRVVFFKDKTTIQKDEDRFHYVGLTINSKNFGKDKNLCIDKIARETRVFGSGCFLSRNLSSIKKFDELFFYTYEDLDFSARNYLNNNKGLVVFAADLYHKDGTQGLSYRKGKEYPSKRMYFLIRNRWFFILKNYSNGLLIATLPINIGVDFLLLTYCLLRCRDKFIFFKSYYSLLLNLSSIWSARKSEKKRIGRNFLVNYHLKFNESTYGGVLLRSLFYSLDSFLFMYGRYILNLSEQEKLNEY